MEYNIVERKQTKHFTSAHLMWISVAIFFSICGAYIFKLMNPNPFFNILLVVSVFMPIVTNVYGNYEYFPMNYKIISKLALHSEKIIFKGRSTEFEKIQKIEIEVNDWYGKKIVTNVRPMGSGPKISRGINNHLKIELENSESIEFDFQIDSFKHFEALAEWVKNLYSTKIEITENYEHARTYGFESLNYQAIQEFKKKRKAGPRFVAHETQGNNKKGGNDS